MADDWTELTVACDREAVEAVAEVFTRYGFTRSLTVEEALAATGASDDFAVAPRSLVNVSTILHAADVGPDAYAEARQSLWLARQALWILGRSQPIGTLKVTEGFANDCGGDRAERRTVVRVGNRLLDRVPRHAHEPVPEETEIKLDAGIAFGTGRHLSTQLSLQALEDELAVGDSVLDVGTGSGVLAIAAALLGARAVAGLDIDPAAVRSAQLNAERNGVGDIVRVALGTVGFDSPFPGTFDLVIANIIAGVLIELAPALARVVSPGGTLIVGGILDDREALVHEAFAPADLTLVRRLESEDWVALAWRKAR